MVPGAIQRMLDGMHPTDERRARDVQGAELEIEISPEPPPLNAGSSRVLLRLLLKAARAEGVSGFAGRRR